MTDNVHHPVTTEISGRSHFTRYKQNLVPIQTEVRVNIIAKPESRLIAIAQIKLKALVFHRTGISPLPATFSKNTDVRRFYQNIRCFFIVIFGRAIQCLIKQTEIHTDIGLCSSFPLDIVISNLSTHKSGRKQTTAITSGNIIRSSISRRITCTVFRFVDRIACVIFNILITGLSPSRTNFQIVNHIFSFFHKSLLTNTPSQRNGRESSIFIIATKTGRPVTTESK